MLTDGVSIEELQLATRNHGMPLEALRYPVTPVGLHYLLIHYDIPVLDQDSWRLRLDGALTSPQQLSLAELRAMPAVSRVVTMECAGNGRALLDPRPASQPWLVEAVGTGCWTGVPLAEVLAAVGLRPQAVDLVFTGADRGIDGGIEQQYQRSLPADLASAGDALLAYELNGAPLPAQHGFPLRLVVPGWYGMTNVKWLTAITAISEPFTGYQQRVAYRMRHAAQELGEPLQRMAPRSLLVPPGIPDFFTRVRTVSPGPCELSGRAWSGHAPVATVEVSADGGRTWAPAELDAPTAGPATTAEVGIGTWQGWRSRWHAEPGEYELCCRATDRAGNTQPLRAGWNHGGYANNGVHRVRVLVAPSAAG